MKITQDFLNDGNKKIISKGLMNPFTNFNDVIASDSLDAAAYYNK